MLSLLRRRAVGGPSGAAGRFSFVDPTVYQAAQRTPAPFGRPASATSAICGPNVRAPQPARSRGRRPTPTEMTPAPNSAAAPAMPAEMASLRAEPSRGPGETLDRPRRPVSVGVWAADVPGRGGAGPTPGARP